MNASDIYGIKRSGAAARVAGRGYFANPHLVGVRLVGSPAEVEATHQACWAWWAGWLEEDGGRDTGIQRLLQLRYW